MNPDYPLYRTPTGLWRSPLLDREEWADHAFGSALARPEGEWLELKQVHSARVAGCGEWREGLRADGLVTAAPRVRLAIKTADCLPILLADPRTRVVAAVHAGWRGSTAGIAIRGVEAMARLHGSRPEEIRAAFGPSIGACCFEVGPEVATQFSDWFPERNDLDRRTRIDLPEANRRQLIGAGLRLERIACQAPCTVCGGALPGGGEFHSWRREHRTGVRMHSLIWIR
ncbi:MAG: peptidoglycan editing factor PgeF [Bryobacteraceae bacterium]